MRLGLGLAFVTVISGTAAADPLTIGADVGAIHDGQSTSGSTVGAFLRARVDRRAWAQFEVGRISLDSSGLSLQATPGSSDITQTAGVLITDLSDGTVVPIVLAAVGLDFASNIIRDNRYLHGEVGAGLELRTGSLTLGIDLRMGTRTIIDSNVRDIEAFYEPRILSEGTYTTGRLRLGLRF